MKDKFDKVLTVFCQVWVILVLLLNVIAVIGFFLGAGSILDGWQRVADTYSPFNFWNLALEAFSLSPAICAWSWRDKRRKRRTEENNRRMFALAARAKEDGTTAEAYQLPDGQWGVRLVKRDPYAGSET